jgi:nicotinamide-nucleotide amidase
VSTRAAIVVTGTELVSGRVLDRNGPWLAGRLGDLGVEVAHTTIVGDRPADLLAALRWCAELGVELVVTSGGLGPTADDLTAAVVGEFCGRAMVLDEALEERIAAILMAARHRWPNRSEAAIRAANRKQAVIPQGSSVLEPVGTAPGLVVRPEEGRQGPTVVVLPGPPRELHALWEQAVHTEAFAEATRRAAVFEQRILRLYGLPESEIVTTLEAAQAAGVALDELEVTTCVRSGELEVVTRFEPGSRKAAEGLAAVIRQRHADTLYSDDGSGVDDQVAARLLEAGLSVAVAESCTGGLVAGRLTDRPGSSAYMRGGVVAYCDEVKEQLAGVDPALLAEHGAVSEEVAVALAQGARERLAADVGIGVTGIAGPGGGTAEKPVGLVWIAVVGPGEARLVRRTEQRGTRADVRERTVVATMHLLRRRLAGAQDTPTG